MGAEQHPIEPVPQVMTVSGLNITFAFPNGQPELLGIGKIVRFYFNDENEQLIAYLGVGTITQGALGLVLPSITLGQAGGIVSGVVPQPGHTIKVEVAFDGVGESWTDGVPTSEGDVIGIVWAVGSVYYIASLQG